MPKYRDFDSSVSKGVLIIYGTFNISQLITYIDPCMICKSFKNIYNQSFDGLNVFPSNKAGLKFPVDMEN